MDDRTALTSALSGRYEIDREIGRGGIATVYLARELRHEGPVAVKLLNPELGAVRGAERLHSKIRGKGFIATRVADKGSKVVVVTNSMSAANAKLGKP